MCKGEIKTGSDYSERPSDEDQAMETCEEVIHDFGWVLKQLRHGLKVNRVGWNGPGQYVTLQVPDENSFMTVPYIYISTVQGDRVPWVPSQTDQLAVDWQLA